MGKKPYNAYPYPLPLSVEYTVYTHAVMPRSVRLTSWVGGLDGWMGWWYTDNYQDLIVYMKYFCDCPTSSNANLSCRRNSVEMQLNFTLVKTVAHISQDCHGLLITFTETFRNI